MTQFETRPPDWLSVDEALRRVAKDQTYQPCDLQAIIWITYKEMVGTGDRRVSE